MIQLLNIAGTGPIFGAIMGAMWGPIVFLWIICGTILGGAVHDYMSGMMSIRNEGRSITDVIARYIGPSMRPFIVVAIVFLLIMVVSVFSLSAAQLLETLTHVNVWFWAVLVFAYFILATILPLDKIIGRFYPIFGIILIIMAVVLFIGLAIGGYTMPPLTLENVHPSGTPMWPFMFITVACGAISGFHSTQSPLVSRCLATENDGCKVFYGAMVTEGIIALAWAAAGIMFYDDPAALQNAINTIGVSGVAYEMSIGIAGTIGGVLAVVGIIICPITSRDTALRAIRLIVADALNISQKPIRNRPLITTFFGTICFSLIFVDFTILWRYFSWLNQTLATVVLWTASIYLLVNAKCQIMSLITALPATFMTATVVTYILNASEGLGMDYTLSMTVGIIVAVLIFLIYLQRLISKHYDGREDLMDVRIPIE